MTYTLYSASIVLIKDLLPSLKNIIKIAEASSEAASIPTAKIYDDMLPFYFQVHTITDTAQKTASRLTGQEPLALKMDDVKTYDAMYKRIDEVLELVSKVDEKVVNERQDEIVTLGMGRGVPDAQIAGWKYVNGYALPNLFFHVTTAYNILRMRGIPIGKQDYLKPFRATYMGL